jgi:hypothetical protein
MVALQGVKRKWKLACSLARALFVVTEVTSSR